MGNGDADSEKFDLHHPHDHFFRKWFGDPQIASDFFRAFLPEQIADWVSDPGKLVLENTSFVSESLKSSESDLLWRCENPGDSDHPKYIYVLFEHQSKPDRLMALRMLEYMVRIWRMLQEQEAGKLPFVYPVVFYQGTTEWKSPVQFVELLDLPDRSLLPQVPDFQFALVSLNEMELEEVPSKLLWLGLTAMSLAKSGRIEDWVLLIRSGTNDDQEEIARFDLIFRYVFATAAPEKRKAMIQEVETQKSKLVDKARSVYELLLMEGREEGIEKGKEEIVLAMSKKGYSAEQIADITGLELDETRSLLAKQANSAR